MSFNVLRQFLDLRLDTDNDGEIYGVSFNVLRQFLD